MKKFTTWLRGIFAAKPQQTPTKKPSAPVKREPYVYVTVKGKKYHLDPCCPSILDAFVKGSAIKMSLSKAKASGRTECNKCGCSDYEDE